MQKQSRRLPAHIVRARPQPQLREVMDAVIQSVGYAAVSFLTLPLSHSWEGMRRLAKEIRTLTKLIIRMSEAGDCPRALSAKFLGKEPETPPSWLEKAAEEGKWHEDRIVAELANEGYAIDNRQLECMIDMPDFTLVGHIDGTVKHWTDGHVDSNRLLEIKSMSQFEFDRWMRGGFEAFPKYATQITCYMIANRFDQCLYVVKNRNNGYDNRRVLTQTPESIDDIVAHLSDVVKRVKNNVLWEDTEFDPQSIQCRRCSYKYLCISEHVPSLVTLSELDRVVELWRRGKSLESEGQELIEEAKTIFKSHAEALPPHRFIHEQLAVTLVHYKESVIYPKANLLKTFTEEQLQPCAETKEAHDQLRITDLAKES